MLCLCNAMIHEYILALGVCRFCRSSRRCRCYCALDRCHFISSKMFCKKSCLIHGQNKRFMFNIWNYPQQKWHTFLLTSAQRSRSVPKVSHNGPDFMKIERGHFFFLHFGWPTISAYNGIKVRNRVSNRDCRVISLKSISYSPWPPKCKRWRGKKHTRCTYFILSHFI